MFQLSGNYLEIKTPVTTNGIIPKIENGRVVYKTTYAPLKARKAFQRVYNKYPEALRPIMKNVTVDEIPEEHLPDLLKLSSLQQNDEPEDNEDEGKEGQPTKSGQSRKTK